MRDANWGVLYLAVLMVAIMRGYALFDSVEIQPFTEPNYLELDSEARLALGKRIDLKEADAYDLELIPGIAAGFSSKIMAGRSEVINAARKLKHTEKYRGLEVIHGIGRKTAERLAAYICLDDYRCY